MTSAACCIWSILCGCFLHEYGKNFSFRVAAHAPTKYQSNNAPVFHYSLPAYLMQELERIQKRAMRIICPGIEYQYALVLVNLSTVAKHHNDICRRTFESICNDSGSKLKKLLPPLHECNYELRHTRTFKEPRCKTNRAKNSFIMASSSLANRF